jgi:hypothetical protein
MEEKLGVYWDETANVLVEFRLKLVKRYAVEISGYTFL